MIRFVPLVLALAACDPIDPMPADLPCTEARAAIAARTLECTGDAALSDARAAAFDRGFACIPWSADDPALSDTSGPRPEDLFSCAFTIRNLPCETVAAHGDDLRAWLSEDPGCTWVAEPKSGGGGR